LKNIHKDEIEKLTTEKSELELSLKELIIEKQKLEIDLKKKTATLDDLYFKIDAGNQIDSKLMKGITSIYDFDTKNKERDLKEKEIAFKEVKMGKDLEMVEKKKELVLAKYAHDNEIAEYQKKKEEIKLGQMSFGLINNLLTDMFSTH
jgi:hypothetical protein